MKNNYTIQIPTPCHENWDAMTPVEQGRFCQSCAKQVVDFSMMTDQELLNYFKKSTGITCGRFNNDQLQRPLQPTKIEKKKTWWVAAMMPLLLMFEKAGAKKKTNTILPRHKTFFKAINKHITPVNGELVMINNRYAQAAINPVNIDQIDSERISHISPIQNDNVGATLVGRVGGYVYCKVLPKQDTVPALIHRLYSKQAFNAHPNPAPRGSNVTITFKNEGDYSIQLFDNSGKLMVIDNYNAAKACLQTKLSIPSSLTAGMYFIRLVNTKNKKQYTRKISVM